MSTPPVISILYADDDLIVVDKPAGMLVHRDARSNVFEPLLLQLVAAQTGRYLHPVHRLDRNTSGVLCFTTSPETTRTLQANLAAPTTAKRYFVLARGTTPESFSSDRPLTDDHGVPKPAHTEARRIATFDQASLLDVRITTGRYHQIRRHLNHLAHHVIGDTTHGKGKTNRYFRDTYGLPRMFIHARRLECLHPGTGAPMVVEAPLAADLRAFLGRIPEVDAGLIGGL